MIQRGARVRLKKNQFKDLPELLKDKTVESGVIFSRNARTAEEDKHVCSIFQVSLLTVETASRRESAKAKVSEYIYFFLRVKTRRIRRIHTKESMLFGDNFASPFIRTRSQHKRLKRFDLAYPASAARRSLAQI